MKKKFVIVLVLAMLVGLLTGCVAMSDERLIINVVYAKSKDADTIDPAEAFVAEDMTALRKNFPSVGGESAGKDYFCDGKEFSEKLAKAAGNKADIVVCVGEEFEEYLPGVAASKSKVKWIWIGGDEALSSDKIYVIPADGEEHALLNKLTEFIEHDLNEDYLWATAPETADSSAEEDSTEEAATEESVTEEASTEEAITEGLSTEETAGE